MSTIRERELSQLQRRYVEKVQGMDYRGMLLHRQLTNKNFLDKIPTFKVRRDDVFVASYPKSGTTWTEEIVSMINHNGRVEKVSKKPLHLRALHFEVGAPSLHSAMLHLTRSARVLATHLPYQLLPTEVQQGKCKVIYVSRNPKDTAISYHYHHRMANFLGNHLWDWDDFFELFVSGSVVYGSWFDHVLGYWAHREEAHALFIKYEDMKKDLFSVVLKIASFLGKDLSDAAVDRIVAHCSFDAMKKNSMCNREKLPKPWRVFDMSETKFMRKGVVGDWKNHFTQEQNLRFDSIYRERMSGAAGLEFEFEAGAEGSSGTRRDQDLIHTDTFSPDGDVTHHKMAPQHTTKHTAAET